MSPSRHEAYEAVARLWKYIPPGLGRDFNIVVTRLENLERKGDE